MFKWEPGFFFRTPLGVFDFMFFFFNEPKTKKEISKTQLSRHITQRKKNKDMIPPILCDQFLIGCYFVCMRVRSDKKNRPGGSSHHGCESNKKLSSMVVALSVSVLDPSTTRSTFPPRR